MQAYENPISFYVTSLSKDVSLLSDNLWYYLPRFFIKSTILQHYFSIPNIA